VKRPECAEVAELLQRFIDATMLDEHVSEDVLDQAQAAVHALLQPVTREEVIELAALGSAVGEGMLKELGARNAASN